MKTVLVTYEKWIDSGHALLDDYKIIKSEIVEVENLTDLNEKFKNIIDIKIMKTKEKEELINKFLPFSKVPRYGNEKVFAKQCAEICIEEMNVNQRELLIEFFKHFRDNGEKNIGMTIEQFVDDFLNIKTIDKCECGFNKRMALDCTSKPCRFKGTFTSNCIVLK